jgi:hypothetical protein
MHSNRSTKKQPSSQLMFYMSIQDKPPSMLLLSSCSRGLTHHPAANLKKGQQTPSWCVQASDLWAVSLCQPHNTAQQVSCKVNVPVLK